MSESDEPRVLDRPIDVHGHFTPNEVVEFATEYVGEDKAILSAVSRIKPDLGRYPILYGDLEPRIPVLDDAGIGLQVLSPARPYIFADDEKLRVELMRRWNDGTVAAIEPHSSRFAMFAGLPLPFVDAAIAETDRVRGLDSVIGVAINTHTLGIAIDDERWMPLYEHWNEIGMVVFLHSDGFCAKGVLDDYNMEVDIGAPLDDTIAAVRLINSELPVRLPNIRWIVPHLGGALPFLMGRLDEHWERDRERRSLGRLPSTALDGLSFDTAGHGQASVDLGIEILGASRVVLGSDFPFVGAGTLGHCVHLVEESPLSGLEREQVLVTNAAGLVG